MSKARWSKFWWDDWTSDLALKSCSLAARGLWMEMLTIMHKSENEGYFLIAGRSVTPKQLAGLVSASEKEVSKCMAELAENRVFSTTDAGVIYSRRMLRDKAAREEAQRNGATGGNPALKGDNNPVPKKTDKGGVNPPDNPDGGGGVIGGDNAPVNTPHNLQDAKKLLAKKEKEERTDLRSDAIASLADANAGIWSAGLKAFCVVTGMETDKARPILGTLRKDAGKDERAVLNALQRALEVSPSDPVAWLRKAVRPRMGVSNGFVGVIRDEGIGVQKPQDDNPVTRFLEDHADVRH